MLQTLYRLFYGSLTFHVLFHQNAGNEEYQKGNYSEAIQLYTKAIELNGQNAIFYSNSTLLKTNKLCHLTPLIRYRSSGLHYNRGV